MTIGESNYLHNEKTIFTIDNSFEIWLSMFVWSLYLTEECLFIVDLVIHWYVTAIDCTKDLAEQTGIYI